MGLSPVRSPHLSFRLVTAGTGYPAVWLPEANEDRRALAGYMLRCQAPELGECGIIVFARDWANS